MLVVIVIETSVVYIFILHERVISTETGFSVSVNDGSNQQHPAGTISFNVHFSTRQTASLVHSHWPAESVLRFSIGHLMAYDIS